MITLINPPLMSHRKDSHSSGIPYLPHGLSYQSAVLKKAGIAHQVVDAFGENPSELTVRGDFSYQGISLDRILRKISETKSEAVILYANSVFNADVTFEIARKLKTNGYTKPVILTENTQAVTGYSSLKALHERTDSGLDFVILGESEAILAEIVPSLLANEKIPALFTPHVWKVGSSKESKCNVYVDDLDKLSFPNWETLPLKNYWNLKYAHGPKEGNYLAILTSRGCPYPCGFCSVPVMNQQRWRKRSPQNVVDEMDFFLKTLGVREFHWEDLNPTIDENRIVTICEEIKARNLKIRWKIVSGTKLDNLKFTTLEEMAASGLEYLSFSPESGSPRVLKLIRKPFQHEKAIKQVQLLNKLKVSTQSCFVLGYPGETKEDLKETLSYMKRLLKAGLSEVAFFIVAPMPGTPIEGKVEGSFTHLSQLTFSPTWREDYKTLVKVRNHFYASFFFYKIIYQTKESVLHCIRFILGKSRVKMEMFLYRKLNQGFARMIFSLSHP